MSMEQRFCEETFDSRGRIEKLRLHYENDFNFAYDVVDVLATESPEKRAIVWCNTENEEHVFTFSDLKAGSDRMANVLRDFGVGRGDPVMLVLKRHYEYWFAMLALHKLGAVAIPATHMLTAEDLQYRFCAADVKAVVATPHNGVPEKINTALNLLGKQIPCFSVQEDVEGFRNLTSLTAHASEGFERVKTCVHDPMLLYFTSGTTGQPKGVFHDFSYPLSHIVTAKYWQQAREGGLHFTVAETGWAKAAWGKMYGQWLVGSAVMVYDFDNFDPRQLTEIINKYGVTSFCAPPTVYRYLMRKGVPPMPTLEHASTAGEMLAPEVFHKFLLKTGIPLCEGYGQTETALIMGNFKGYAPEESSMGLASPLYHVEILKRDGSPADVDEIGEVVIVPENGIRPEGVFSGYLNNPRQYEKVWRGGVYHTGDSACRDQEGRCWFCGRFDDVIKTGGFRVGPDEETLLSGKKDPYEAYVRGEDRTRYRSFLEDLRKAPAQRCLVYRLVGRDGKVSSVEDRFTTWVGKDGMLRGEGTVSLASQNPQVPWGYLRCTCEKQPRITYMNEAMKTLLRLPSSAEGEADCMELYEENIFLILPMEERRRFSRYLQRICTEDIPVFGEVALLRCDGTRAHVFGWVTRGRNGEGTEEFQAVCLDITERYECRKEQNSRRYISALRDVYDKIFQYDLEEGILKCLYDAKSSRFRLLQNIPMQLEKATETWVSENVVPEEQRQVRDFFHAYCRKGPGEGSTGPSRISYHAKASSGEIKYYSGIFLQAEDNIRLYCCRCMEDERENDQLRSENHSLKENMQELMLKFTDGIAAFQLSDGAVTPLYVTDNICKFFGRTREEWLPMMKTATPIPEFVSRANVDYEKFETLLQEGEAEFSYLDLQTQKIQHMKAICSHKSPCEGVPRYVMLYNADTPREERSHVYIRTFGYFDVFVDDTPIAFRNRKSKELLALLVDRRGGFVSSEEAISYLWEEEPVNPVTLARYRKVALRLKNILMEYGISEIVESVDGKRRIDCRKVSCDLYDYLTGREEYAGLFKGSYLTNYSWGETTLAELSCSLLY